MINLQLPSFVEELRREREFDEQISLLLELLILNGQSIRDVEEIPLSVFFDMLRNLKTLLQLNGVMIK